jgi:hypothetical protein
MFTIFIDILVHLQIILKTKLLKEALPHEALKIFWELSIMKSRSTSTDEPNTFLELLGNFRQKGISNVKRCNNMHIRHMHTSTVT